MLIEENTLKFSIQGMTFGGIYNMTINIEAIMDPIIENAIVNVDSYINASDIDILNALVQEKFDDWVQKGLTTLNMIEGYSKELLSVAQEPDCNCEQEIRCQNPLEKYCSQYDYDINPLNSSTACKSVSMACVSTTVYCIEEISECTEWVKNIPNTCKTHETTCTKSVNICNKWVEDCKGIIQGAYNSYEILSINKCVQDEYRCDEKDYPDLQCESECVYQTQLYEQDVEIAKTYQSAYNLTVKELEGFFNLETVEIIFVGHSAKLTMELNETVIENEKEIDEKRSRVNLF